ncbi:MAG: D-alanyl-D-alanine carboxypeptidase [Clostridia bacterium]|nr:D-alanyl-D-alanine carboxypeptidase [Clostridia bacterium]
MKSVKSIISIVLCLCVLSCSRCIAAKTVSSECDIEDINVPIPTSSNDAAQGVTLEINAKSAILMEPKTGEILYEMNSNEPLPPASITKIMSLLLIMEAIDSGSLTVEDVVSTSEHAASMGGSQIWLEPGESMTVDDLLKATVIASANDATVALGEYIAGSEEGFVAMMNDKAKSLGMNNTTFINCTGLDAEGHITTAHDVAIMSSELIKHPLIKKYSTVWMDTLRDGESELVNTNKLVRFYEGTTGLKTGTTSKAGYCLSATAEKNGTEMVAVIMGGNTSDDRFAGAKKLLDYGFANFSFMTVAPKLEKDTYIKVENGVSKQVRVDVSDSFDVLLKKGQSGEISQKMNLKQKLSAPVKKGDTVGTVDIYSGNTHIGSVKVTAGHNVDKISFSTTLLWLVKGLFTP